MLAQKKIKNQNFHAKFIDFLSNYKYMSQAQPFSRSSRSPSRYISFRDSFGSHTNEVYNERRKHDQS